MVIQAAVIIFIAALSVFAFTSFSQNKPTPQRSVLSSQQNAKEAPKPTVIPEKKVLGNNYHIFQSFNNCGPASLSMTLSYFGIKKSQEKLGQEMRPYQVANGDNDDKSVTFDEMAVKAEELGLTAYHRPNGNIEMMEQFIAADIPVITKTWLHADEDIGHYRIVKGYDKNAKTILQDDSFQNKNLTYTYDEFNEIWEKFNYEYLILVPKDKEQVAESILGKNLDEKYAWEQAKQNSLRIMQKNSENIYNRFNLSVAYYYLGDYKNAVAEYEKIASQLPFRTLWYQLEPVKAYYELGDYDKVFAISDEILNNNNRAYSELYLLRGQIYQKQGDLDNAKNEYEQAVYYNQNLKSAKDALNSI